MTASASDNVGVTGVQFKLDGANLNGALTASPYSQSLDTTKLSNGPHTIAATATDAAEIRGTPPPSSSQ
ncbi:MAG: Ig-like domain-containing protein [Ignavibacteriota bacterium]